MTKLARVLAIVAAMSMLITALPAAITSAASPTACKVWNSDKEIGRDSLQRAVWAASPGDHLWVRGTCVGSAIIRKDVHIAGYRLKTSDPQSGVRDSGKPTLVGDPAFVVDPRVARLTIAKGLTVHGGFVIGDGREGRAPSPAMAPRLSGFAPAAKSARTCRVFNSGNVHRSLQDAVSAASSGDRLMLLGTCLGQTRIDQNLLIGSIRIAAAGTGRPSHPADSGPPRIGIRGPGPAISVGPDVTSLMMTGIIIRGGISIGS